MTVLRKIWKNTYFPNKRWKLYNSSYTYIHIYIQKLTFTIGHILLLWLGAAILWLFSMLFLSDFFCKVIYQGVMSTCRVWLNRESFSVLWTTVSGTVFLYFKGQLISKCPFGVIIWTKIPMKFFPGFLS